MYIKKKRCREDNKGGMITSRFVCMVNLNCILAIFPEWGQKVPPLSLFGGEKRPHIYYGTSFIRVESFCFILSSWKKFWLNRGWNDDKI